MSFTLKQLKYFASVAAYGSVSRAARDLSISQSAVTEAVKGLEGLLGTKLFERHSRGLELTQKGQQFLRHAKKILSEVSNASRAFDTVDKQLTGHLNIGVTPLMAGYVLSELLARYSKTNPAVEVSVLEENGEYLEHLLVGGELDIAVMITSNMRNQHALEIEFLTISPFRRKRFLARTFPILT